MEKQERWLPVVGYEDGYEVSSAGNVRSVTRLDSRGTRHVGRVLSPGRVPSGHLTVGLYSDGVARSLRVHTLVLRAFVGTRPDGMEACHWNDEPSDNRIENLRWGTRSENLLDSVRNGKHHLSRRTHCRQGHEYTDQNTYVYPAGDRSCIECGRNHTAKYRESHREEIRKADRERKRNNHQVAASKSGVVA